MSSQALLTRQRQARDPSLTEMTDITQFTPRNQTLQGPTGKIPWPKTLGEMVELISEMQAYIQRLQDGRTAQNDEINKLKQETLDLASKIKKGNTNTEVVDKISTITKHRIFPKNKFILTEEASMICMLEAATIYFEELGKDIKKMNKKEVNLFLHTYEQTMLQTVAGQRTYACSRLCKAAKIFAKENNFIPSPEQIVKCALRTINVNQAQNKKVMEWYWSVLASKFCASWSELIFSVCPFPLTKALLSLYF